MSISLSISSFSDHVDGAGSADSPAPMSMDDAVYRLVHGAPGGVQALAARMGVPFGTLTHKANPNNTTHHMRPQELVDAQLLGGQHHALHAMAHALGYTCTRATPDQAGGDPQEAHMALAVAHAEFVRAFADAVMAGNEQVTRNQVRRAEHCAQEAIAALNHAVATLRGRMRPAPKVEG